MFRKLFLVPAVLSSLLMLSGSAFAQHRGGRSGGGRGAAVAHSSAGGNRGAAANRGVVARSGTFNRGYAGNGNYANYGGRNFNNRGYYGGGYYGGYWPGYYGNYPAYGYNYPDYSYAPPIAAVAPQVAYIHVFVSDPQAHIWVNGQLTRQTGTDRTFSTPPIAAGATYQIRVGWMEGDNETTRDQTVTVTPGATSMVDFTGTSTE